MVVDSNKIGKRLSILGMSKSKLARKMNVADMTIIRKMQGKSEWTFKEVWELTQILDCEMNDLLKKEEE